MSNFIEPYLLFLTNSIVWLLRCQLRSWRIQERWRRHHRLLQLCQRRRANPNRQLRRWRGRIPRYRSSPSSCRGHSRSRRRQRGTLEARRRNHCQPTRRRSSASCRSWGITVQQPTTRRPRLRRSPAGSWSPAIRCQPASGLCRSSTHCPSTSRCPSSARLPTASIRCSPACLRTTAVCH